MPGSEGFTAFSLAGVYLFSVSQRLVRLVYGFAQGVLFLMCASREEGLSCEYTIFRFFLGLGRDTLTCGFNSRGGLYNVQSLTFFLRSLYRTYLVFYGVLRSFDRRATTILCLRTRRVAIVNVYRVFCQGYLVTNTACSSTTVYLRVASCLGCVANGHAYYEGLAYSASMRRNVSCYVSICGGHVVEVVSKYGKVLYQSRRQTSVNLGTILLATYGARGLSLTTRFFYMASVLYHSLYSSLCVGVVGNGSKVGNG